ncbi:MAG: CBS domain-containing protein [Fimbriimonadales bacterium]|nr:CBS domain-containing protein [Fimbriimonadales bacterium]
MRVLEFINTHAPTLRLGATLQDAIDKLDLYQVTMLPVLDDAGQVRGIVTEKRLFRQLFARLLEALAAGESSPSLAELREAAQGQAQTPIARYMTARPPVIDERASVDEAVALMYLHDLDALPVIGEGRFVGTIRLVDCCQALLEENP